MNTSEQKPDPVPATPHCKCECLKWLSTAWKCVRDFPSPNNRFERWATRLQIIGIVVGALIIWQIWESADELQATKYANANSWMLDLDKTFLDKSDLRPYFYEGKAIPKKTDKDYQQVMAMSEYILDSFDSFISHRFPNMPVQPSWKNWMIFYFDHSPALTNYISEHIDWYNSDSALYNKIYKEWYATNCVAKISPEK